MDRFYFEIHITPNNFFDIFVHEIIEFTKEAIEENDEDVDNCKASIIIRTNKTEKFINDLISHLQNLSYHLTKTNDIDISFDYKIHKKENKDWIKIYQESIVPIKCGSFYIRPPWIKKEDEGIDIILEPSLAFGSGHHSSTCMCIKAIESCEINKNTTILDVGCGSGILSICANKLGGTVSLCDIDELAIEQSIKSFSANGAAIDKIWIGQINDDYIDDTYVIVVANIVASVLINIKTQLISKLKDNAYLILSGIIDKCKDEVLNAFCHLKLVEEYTQNEWVCLKFKAKA